MRTKKLLDGFYKVSNENGTIYILKQNSLWILQHNQQKEIFRTKKSSITKAQNILSNK